MRENTSGSRQKDKQQEKIPTCYFLKAAFKGETISLGSKTCLKLPHDEAFCYLPEGHFIIWTSSLRLHFLPSLKLGWEGHSAQMSLCGLKGKRPLIPLHVHKVSPPVPGGKHHWGFHCLLQCPEFPEVTWSTVTSMPTFNFGNLNLLELTGSLQTPYPIPTRTSLDQWEVIPRNYPTWYYEYCSGGQEIGN